VAPALAADLTLTAVGIVWLGAVRPGHVRAGVLVPIALLGLAASRRLIDLATLGALGAALELALAGWMLIRIGRIVGGVRAARRGGHELVGALEAGLGRALPAPLAAGLAGELGAVALALTGWWQRPPTGFGHHRRAAYGALVGALGCLIAGESLAVHLAVAQWSTTGAWIATALSAYSLVWMIGDAHAVRLGPARVTDAGLVVSRGLVRRAAIPWAAIAAVAPVAGKVAGAIDLAVLGPNLLITLTAPIAVRGPLGTTRRAARLTLGVDDRETLCALIAARRADTSGPCGDADARDLPSTIGRAG
jgi:hypothetical protein